MNSMQRMLKNMHHTYAKTVQNCFGTSYRMLVFDLDGTLCPLGKGMLPRDVERLRRLENAGYQIVVCSGKPTYYLCGFLRQVGLDHPIMVGENGATVQFGVDLPPKQYYEHPYSSEARAQIRFFRDAIDKACGSLVWYQPNEVELTPFVREASALDIIQGLVDAHDEKTTELNIYRFVDCFDFVPKNINKMNGMKFLGELTGIPCEQMISFGDGINDIPMFQGTGMSVGIGDQLSYPTDLHFETIGEALAYIEHVTEGESV